MKKALLILALAGLAAGCTQARSTSAAAEAAAKEAADIKASVLEDAPCLIGLGAWARMEDPRKRDGIFYTCVPDAGRYGVSMDAP